MNSESALEFLRQNQPLPTDASNELLATFNEVRQIFMHSIDERCIPLLIGALGGGDGHGIYQLIEDTLLKYPRDKVIAALIDHLEGSSQNLYWALEIAAAFPSDELITPLVSAYKENGQSERMAVLMALESIGGPKAEKAIDELSCIETNSTILNLINNIKGCSQ